MSIRASLVQRILEGFMRIIAALLVVSAALLGSATPAECGVVEVIGHRPEGALDSISDAASVSVIFDSPVVPLGALAPDPVRQGPFTIEPPVAGTFHFLGTRTVEFRPDEPLPRATTFTVRLSHDLPTLDGVWLADDVEWRFETPRPKLVSCSLDGVPGPSWDDPLMKWVAPDSDIYLWFDQPVDLESTGNAITIGSRCEVVALGDTCVGGAASARESSVMQWSIRYATEEEFANLTDPMKEGREWCSVQRARRDVSDPHAFVIVTPAVELARGTLFQLDVAAGIAGAEGGLTSERGYTIDFWTRGDLCFVGLRNADVHDVSDACGTPERGKGILCPDNVFVALFSNPVGRKAFAGALSFNPPVAIPDDINSYDTAAPHLSLQLQPDTEYEVAVDETLSDIFGNRLGRPLSFKFQTGDYDPRVEMPTGFQVVEQSRAHVLPVSVLNPDPMHIRMARIAPRDVVAFCQRDSLFWRTKHIKPDGVVRYSIDRPLSPELSRNVRSDVPIDLEDALGDGQPGFLYVELRYRGGGVRAIILDRLFGLDEARYAKALVQVTDLGVTSKIAPERTLVWVTSLDTGQPLAGVAVELRGDDGRLWWRGETGESGVAEGPGWLGLPRGHGDDEDPGPGDIWVLARQGDDTAMVAPMYDFGIASYRYGVRYESKPAPEVIKGSVFTDQGIYRAGDEVRAKGIVRGRKLGEHWKVVGGMPLRVSVVDGMGQTVYSDTLALNSWGAFDIAFDLDSDASLGYYSIRSDTLASSSREWKRCRSIRATFRVEAFRPAEFEVKVRPERSEVVRGDVCQASVSGRYMFGSAMANADVAWSARMMPGVYWPPGYAGYRFGPIDRNRSGRGYGPMDFARGKLDETGSIGISVPSGAGSDSSPMLVLFDATVMSSSRQEVSGQAEVLVHPGLHYIGIKPHTMLAEAGAPFLFDLVAVTPDGNSDPGREVSVRVVHRQWHSVRKTSTGGSYRWVTEKEDTVVDSMLLVTVAQPHALETVTAASGFYVIIAESVDQRGNRIMTECPFYASGGGYAAWARLNNDKVEMVADAERYSPGETARILVKSPYERAHALITVERERVISSWTTELIGTSPEIEIPLTDEYLPNVYVSVMLVSGRTADVPVEGSSGDLGKPALKVGYIELKVDPGVNHLTVDVAADREVYEPGDVVTLDIGVVDSGGDGARAELTVAVVDLGVLNLTEYSLPDPFGSFYSRRALSVGTRTLYSQIVEQIAMGEKGELTSGDGGGSSPEMALRGDFATSAYWNPSLVTDSQGRAQVSFQLPDNLTSWKVMVVAHTTDSKFGSGDATFRVAKPFMLQPSLPRFARLGDEFSAGVVAHNQTDRSGYVSVRAAAEGLTLSGPAERTVYLDPGESREVTFPFAADVAGVAAFRFEGDLRGDSGSTERDGLEIRIPIIEPVGFEVVATAGATDGSAREAIVVPPDARPGSGGIEIEASSTVLLGLEDGVGYLRDYPYGCVEQRVSSILPWILGGDVIEVFALSELPLDEVREEVQSVLDKLPSYQDRSGGFKYWPSSRTWNPYATAYVTLAMLEAKRGGYAVNEQSLESALECLRTLLRRKRGVDSRYSSEEAMLATEALAVYVLARAGTPESLHVATLYGKRENMPLFGRAFLLRAAAMTEGAEDIRQGLVREFNNHMRISPTEAHIEDDEDPRLWWCWHTPVRTTAIVLGALLEAEPDHPMAASMVRWLLSSRRNGRWGNTQENVYAFDAIARYFAIYESEDPNFDAVIRLAGGTVLAESFRGRSQNAVAVELGLEQFASGVEVPLEVSKTGQGRLYYTVRMTYCPTDPAPPRDEGFFLDKEITPFESSPASDGSFEAGTLLLVRLRLAVPEWRTYVVVDDPLPAGFEAVNLSLSTESREVARTLRESGDRRWPMFEHVEMRDDRVVLFADWLDPGVHEFTYLVRAITRGTFDSPAPRVMQMYSPEVFGTGSAGTVTVR